MPSCIAPDDERWADAPHRELTGQIIGAAMKVHTALGPGLLEAAYSACLAEELESLGVRFETQVQVPIRYGTRVLDVGFRLDLLAEQAVVVEVKAIAEVSHLHRAQVLTYLKLLSVPIALLLNFHVLHMRNGIERFINSARLP